MARKRGEPTPRRAPRTADGEAIVESILDAAERLIAQQGLDRMTTNAVARLAGVSVGSLYQYFPNKAAIADAAYRRSDERGAERTLRAMELADERSAIEAMVSSLVRPDAARAALLTEVPSSSAHDAHARVRAKLATAIEGEARDVKAFVAYHALVSVVRAAIVQEPALLEDPAFRRELALLAERYLRDQPGESRG